MQERVFLIKWETKILFMLDRKMKWNKCTRKKPLPKPKFKWRVDGNFEAKNIIKGSSGENCGMFSRLILEQHHPAQCQNPCGFDSETDDNTGVPDLFQ